MPRRYLTHANDLPVLRGRLNVTRQFSALAADPSRLACHYDALTPDIALNKIMKRLRLSCFVSLGLPAIKAACAN
jgi:5-methylcytosine-specific restriction enzyme subunit McrC